MRVPLRLTAEIFKAKLGSTMRGRAEALPILRLRAPVSDLEEGADLVQAEEEILSRVKASSAPAVWFGGGEPLQYAGMGHLARRVVDLGRTVFVETDGALLRRRIFSFRPVERLFLVVQVNGLGAVHDRRAGWEGLYRGLMEGIRAARLSGFGICVKTGIFEDTALEEIRELRKLMEELDLDGWVITPGLQSVRNEATRKMIGAARELAGRSWGKFSRLVELSEAESAALGEAVTAEISSSEEPQEEYEEGVQVP